MSNNIIFIESMRKCLLRIIGVCLFIMLMNTVVLAQVKHQNYFTRAELHITSITATDGNIYSSILYSNLQQTDEQSKPCLPVKYVKLIIPADQDVEKVLIKDTSKVAITVPFFVYPAQPPIPTSTSYEQLNFVPPDSAVYGSNQPYPSDIVKVVHKGYFDGCNHIVTLAVYPIQYQPKSGKLSFFSVVDFELELKAGKMPIMAGGIRSRKNQGIYDGKFTNIRTAFQKTFGHHFTNCSDSISLNIRTLLGN